MMTALRGAKALLALSAAGIALIQATATIAAAPPVETANTTAADSGNDEIIVTAQRRDESIQDVPMTLQALSGDTLGQLNVTTFNDLLKYTPNVTYGGSGPGEGVIFMRGLSAGVAASQSAATISTFPNVALYLDDQSMQFPARNADIYVADLERIEVLEGPQGTLFGGGAEAGAVRYITNKPKLDAFSGRVEGTFGGTASGAPNGAFTATVNVPVVTDKLAIRAVIYGDHHGGYIDNVASTFTRRATDTGSVRYAFVPSPGNQSNEGQYNNFTLANRNYNPLDTVGGRIAAKWQIDSDWEALISESYQDIDASGTFATYPTGSDFQTLGALQTTTFSPSYNKDTLWNTAWGITGKISDFKLIYSGSYMVRHVEQQQDYTNYSRTPGGMYYQCVGANTKWEPTSGPTYCYSPVAYWRDSIRNTHHGEELRIQSPDDKRIRAIVGGYYENFKIYDVMQFSYLTIPNCTTAVIAANQPCSGVVQTVPGSTANRPGLQPPGVAFGGDTQRGYRQFAFYGSVDFDILPTVTLTAGTRYYNYKEFEVGSQFETNPSACYQVVECTLPAFGNVNIDANNDHVTYHGFKSRGVMTWKPQRGTLLYGLFSQGFRPGGFNRTTALILPGQNGIAQYVRPNGYTPDTLTNWEVGLKTDLFGRKATLNVSAYYMIWENTQLQFFNPNGGFGNTAFVTNGANFHVKGVEAQFSARPIDGLSIQIGATYNDSKQTTTPCLISNNPGSSTLGQCITTYYKNGSPIVAQSPFGNLGSPLPYSPHFQGSARARYEWPGTANINWFIGGGVSYTGAMYNQPSTYPSGEGVAIPGTTLLRYRMAGYTLVDAQVGFRKDSWNVAVFGENLSNTHASTFTSSTQFIKSEVPVRPLTYGVKVGVSF